MTDRYADKIKIVLFVNSRKQTERHPDYQGAIEWPDGQKFELSAWRRTSAKGTEFISGLVGDVYGAWRDKKDAAGGSPPGPVGPSPAAVPVAPAGGGRKDTVVPDVDDDIPF